MTGGAGFIGSHVADFFLNKGFEVVIVDASREGFRVRCNDLIRGDQLRAMLRVPRSGDLAVEIRWTRGLEAGGIFLDGAPDVK